MPRVFVLSLFSLFIIVCASVLQRSRLCDHVLFVGDRASLYEDVANDGSFSNPLPFWIVTKIAPIFSKFQPGEYIIRRDSNILSLMQDMVHGRTVVRKITIPEGFTVKMVVDKINSIKYLSGNIDKVPAEGSLFPSTYFYKRGDQKIFIIKKMKNKMSSVIKRLLNGMSQEFIDATITMASIIEKESCVLSEKPVIASVFRNRLLKKMRLQSDPTVVYAVSNMYGRIDRSLTKKDLFFESPYNTYRKGGLPPTPICCPSESSIVAAINPSDSNFLYFVVNKNGDGHNFSADYKSHLSNVRSVRATQRNQSR